MTPKSRISSYEMEKIKKREHKSEELIVDPLNS